MAASKNKYELVLRDNNGQDRTLTVEGTKAEQEPGGRLVIYDGEEQVGGFISVISWHKA